MGTKETKENKDGAELKVLPKKKAPPKKRKTVKDTVPKLSLTPEMFSFLFVGIGYKKTMAFISQLSAALYVQGMTFEQISAVVAMGLSEQIKVNWIIRLWRALFVKSHKRLKQTLSILREDILKNLHPKA